MASICILTGNHLCHNPRVIKEAGALSDAGFKVEVLGGWLNTELAERDLELIESRKFTFTPVFKLVNRGQEESFAGYWMRAQRWFGIRMHRWLRWENPGQLGYGIQKLEAAARTRRADLYIAHSEPGLWVAKRLRRLGFRIAVDMEDWFSEDLLPEARRQRPLKLLRRLEQDLLRTSVHTSCTSQAMSVALAQEFGCRPPTVISNAFAWAERRNLDGTFKDRRDRKLPSIHWYSQTLGQGRGLEDLLGVLVHLNHRAEIHLRGKPANGFENWLTTHVPDTWRERIFIHDLVPNHELLSRIAEHDIGFAGEMKYCRSRELTVTNKILHYLLAGLGVVASDTAGQREIAAKADGAVLLYRSGDAASLAERLDELLGRPDRLAQAKASALRAAEQTFCWEKYVSKLLRSVEKALCAPNR